MASRAPELLRDGGVAKGLTLAVDMWSLGALGFFILTGHPSPFAASGAEKERGLAYPRLRIGRICRPYVVYIRATNFACGVNRDPGRLSMRLHP